MPIDKTKPPYRVPLISEIREIEWNGFTVASTFAGAGGSSTGYRMAGFRVGYANEFVPIAQESYRANCAPYTFVDGRDVKTVKGAEILERCSVAQGDLDVFDGSPPCQAFSTAGRREKGWGKNKSYEHGAEQKNEQLFDEYIRLRDEMMPRTFVAENVSGLVKGTAKGFFIEIMRKLRKGYRVEARLLDAQWLGVPQARQRIIIVGVREDLEIDPVFPKPLQHRYSVRDALPWLTRAVHDTHGTFKIAGEITNRPAPTVVASGAYHFDAYGPEPETDISGQAIGAEYDRLNPGQQSEKYFSLVRADAEKPSPTITAAGGQNAGIATVVHPTEKRKFMISEVKRLCSFPDDFVLVGKFAQQWERLGNSVPPVMMRAVAETIRDQVLIPARAAGKIGGPPPRSRGRSTIAKRPKDAARRRGA
jgi:DNA (cytosine-5)-methyltransferase 1